MIIYPAIDLIGGAVVRLNKGDFDQQTTYGTDPISVAKSYAEDGASWLHLVDLDGAKNPGNRQLELITRIIDESGLKVQTGGGIRSADDVAALVNAGASRVVVGSLAVRDFATGKALLDRFGGETICLAADVMPTSDASGQISYNIALSGWLETSDLSLFDFLGHYAQHGLEHALCTDIARDGMMTGCNRDLYASVKSVFPEIKLQASGGVSKLDDIVGLPTDGVIIGKALYEGVFSVGEALEAVAC